MKQSIVESRGHYIFVQPPDIVSVTAIKVLAYKIDEVRKELGMTKVLVEVRNRKSASHSASELLDIARFAAGLFRDNMQFAVLVNYRPVVHGFFGTISETIGMKLNFFEDESAALEWLGVEE